MTDTEDLEQKIDLVLENIELKTENRFLNSTANNNLAYLLGRREYNKIIEHAQKLIKEDPKNYFAFYYFGLALNAQRKYTQAIEALNKAIDLRQRPEFYDARGRVYAATQRDHKTPRDNEDTSFFRRHRRGVIIGALIAMGVLVVKCEIDSCRESDEEWRRRVFSESVLRRSDEKPEKYSRWSLNHFRIKDWYDFYFGPD